MNNMWKQIGVWNTINVAILVVSAVGLGMMIGDRSNIGWMINLIGIMTFSVSNAIQYGRFVKETLIAMALAMLGTGVVGYLMLWGFSRLTGG